MLESQDTTLENSFTVDYSTAPASIGFSPVFNVAVPFIDRHLQGVRSSKTAIRTVDGDITHGELAEKVNRCGNVLKSLGTDLGESHTFQYTIDISPPPKKKKTKPAKQRVSITPEERAQRRRAYEQARNQLPHRRELKRRKEKERHEQAKELGLCRTCRSPAMPGRTRCQDCIEKRRLQQIQAREKAIQQKQGTLGQPPLF